MALFIFVISVSYCDPCVMIQIILWSCCQNLSLKFNDTKEHWCTLFSYLEFLSVQLKCRVHLNFIFHLDVMAATSVYLVICQNRSNKLERKFWIILFWLHLSLSYQHNVMTTQTVHSNLRFGSVFTFSVNYVKYRNLLQYALYHSVSWHHRIVTRALWCASHGEVLASSQPSLPL